MDYTYGPYEPETVTTAIVCGQKQRTVRIDIAKSEEQPDAYGMPGDYRWKEIALPPGVWGYGVLVAAIVRTRYSDDEMTAIINNHLLDADNAETRAEWDAMQAWRAEAKATAHRLLSEYL